MKIKFLAPVFIPAALALVADVGPAMAALDFNIFESMGNLVIETSGSLILPPPIPNNIGDCSPGGAFIDFRAVVCTGVAVNSPVYSVSGTTSFPTSGSSSGSIILYPADSVSGTLVGIFGSSNNLFMNPSYVPGTPIVSSAIFTGITLADIGLTPSSGTIGTWTLTGTGDTINVNVVPGPLPVLGAGIAFGVSRRLRRRIQSSRSGVSA
jgi:hypothetical protein